MSAAITPHQTSRATYIGIASHVLDLSVTHLRAESTEAFHLVRVRGFLALILDVPLDYAFMRVAVRFDDVVPVDQGGPGRLDDWDAFLAWGRAEGEGQGREQECETHGECWVGFGRALKRRAVAELQKIG